MALRIVTILFPLFAIIALGFVLGRRRRPSMETPNQLNIDVFSPALVFSALATQHLSIVSYLPLALASAGMLLASGVIAWVVARLARVQARTLVPPMVFMNSGNLGLPLAVLAFGPEGLAPAVVIFTVTNLLHFSLGLWYLDGRVRLSTVWRTPTIVAAVAGVVVSLSGVTVWEPLRLAIEMVGDVSIPLMLIALGVRLATSRVTSIGIGILGAVLRPTVGMLVAAAAAAVARLPADQTALLLVFGSLPPAVLNYMFAEAYNVEPDKVATIVLIGSAASVITLPLALAIAL